MYRSEWTDDPRLLAILQSFSKKKKGFSQDVKTACEIMMQVSSGAHADRCLQTAYAMTRYMDCLAEDVVALFLWDGFRRMAFSPALLQQHFPKGRARRYWDRVSDAMQSAERREGCTEEECIERYLMVRVCDSMYDVMVSVMARHGVGDTACVWQAYELARRAHYWDPPRLSGEHYLAHPLRAARILADLGLESTIVAAAVLHDTVEDTSCTLDVITDKCGKQIACYVDAVTSVHRMMSVSKEQTDYQNDKHELDERSFEKLVNMVSADPKTALALYVKAADRMDNLRTMEVVDSVKRHDKTDETQMDYLPLFKRFGMYYFADQIEDLMWRVNNPSYYCAVQTAYEECLAMNQNGVEESFRLLKEHLDENYLRLCGVSNKRDATIQVIKRTYTPLEVYRRIQHACGSCDVTATSIEKKWIPLCDAEIIIDTKDEEVDASVAAMWFVKRVAGRLATFGCAITGIETDAHRRVIVCLEDRHRSAIRCCFVTANDHRRYMLGEYMPIAERELMTSGSSDGETVCVKLRNGDRRTFPAGSTVLDLAFSIHEEVGLAAYAATINGHRAEIYHVLHDGDQVIVRADTYRENGRLMKFIPHARIGWFQSIKTETARKKLVRFLERKYEGDNPRYESKVSDESLDTAADRYLSDVKGVYA